MQVVRFSMALTFTLMLATLAQAKPDKEQPKGDKPAKQKEKSLEVGKDGLNIDSSLNDKDAKDTVRKEHFSKVFLVKLVKGKTYQIDMSTNDFDSYLRLENSKNMQLAEDDDSGGDLNARIVFHADRGRRLPSHNHHL